MLENKKKTVDDPKRRKVSLPGLLYTKAADSKARKEMKSTVLAKPKKSTAATPVKCESRISVKATPSKAASPKSAPKKAPSKNVKSMKPIAPKKATPSAKTATKAAPAKKPAAKKPAPAKPEPKKAAPAKKPAAKKPAPAKPEPKKAAPAKKPAPEKPAPAKPEPKKAAPAKKPAPAKPESKKATPAKKPAPEKPAPEKSESKKAAPAKPEPHLAQPLTPPVDDNFEYDDDFEEIPEEPPLTPEEIEKYRRLLVNDDGRLLRKSRSLQDQSLVRFDDDRREELGGDDIARTTELRKASMSEDSSKQIQLSLRKMEEGTYGKCQSCGKQIPRGRLDAHPQALYCIFCQESIEEEEKRTNFTNRNNE